MIGPTAPRVESVVASSQTLKIELTELKQCGGPVVREGDTVTLLYRVALSEKELESGEVLEENYSPEIPIQVRVTRDDLLEGVFRGLVGMRAGGSIRRLYLPSELAFGDRGWGPVPPGADLVVDVLVSVLVTRGQNESLQDNVQSPAS